MEHSIGVNAVKSIENKDTGIREVSEWKLWEVSTLPAWGANDKALTTVIKDISELSREDLEKEILFLKGLLNISSYDDLKLEQIEKQYNKLNEVKAALGAADQHSASRTLTEWRELINIK